MKLIPTQLFWLFAFVYYMSIVIHITYGICRYRNNWLNLPNIAQEYHNSIKGWGPKRFLRLLERAAIITWVIIGLFSYQQTLFIYLSIAALVPSIIILVRLLTNPDKALSRIPLRIFTLTRLFLVLVIIKRHFGAGDIFPDLALILAVLCMVSIIAGWLSYRLDLHAKESTLENPISKEFAEEFIRNWTEENRPVGEYLGYPDCCIEAFCKEPPELMVGYPSQSQKQRFKAAHMNGVYTGFIPCKKHAVQILNREIELSDLIEDRKHPVPFPNAYRDRAKSSCP